jgi:hypothetical protein
LPYLLVEGFKSKHMLVKIKITFFLAIVASQFSFGQKIQSAVVFEGVKNLVLANKESVGKLTSGETVRAWCDHGACGFKISFNGRNVTDAITDNLDDIEIYEFDFGGDGEKEIVVLSKLKPINKKGDYDPETIILSVYHYSKGLMQKLFLKNVGLNYKTVVKKNYIEHYLPSGLDEIWHYYKGYFYKMTPVQIKD